MTTAETILQVFGVIAGLASFYGAYLSFKSMNQAKTSAQQAESARDQIINHQTTTEFAHLLFQARTVQQTFGKYSISQPLSLAGVNFEKDGEILNNFIYTFNEMRSKLVTVTTIKTDDVYHSLNLLQSQFTAGMNATEKSLPGIEIRLIIDDIISKMREVIDSRNTEIIK